MPPQEGKTLGEVGKAGRMTDTVHAAAGEEGRHADEGGWSWRRQGKGVAASGGRQKNLVGYHVKRTETLALFVG